MAKAKSLEVGKSYPVKGGSEVGSTAVVVDNTPVPDGQPDQRKILVEIDGDPVMILPRFLDDGSVTPGEAKARAVITATTAVPSPQLPTVEEDPIEDVMDSRLDVYRPDPDIMEEYVSRLLPGRLKDTDVLLSYWRERKNLMLVGDTQSGKTMAVMVMAVLAAKEMGLPKPLPVFTLSGSSGVTDFDLFGQPTAYTDDDGVERIVWLSGVVDLAARVGGILYIDEANVVDERAISSLNPLTDDRRFFVNRQKAVKASTGSYIPEVVYAHKDLWIVGTYNDGYRGTGTLQEAFSNRFVHLPWDYDEEVEKALIKSKVIRDMVGSAIRSARDSGTISTPVGTRALQNMESAALQFGASFAVWSLLGMFPGYDRDRVETILTERSIETLLSEELASNS